jgi:hypothetical protein
MPGSTRDPHETTVDGTGYDSARGRLWVAGPDLDEDAFGGA